MQRPWSAEQVGGKQAATWGLILLRGEKNESFFFPSQKLALKSRSQLLPLAARRQCNIAGIFLLQFTHVRAPRPHPVRFLSPHSEGFLCSPLRTGQARGSSGALVIQFCGMCPRLRALYGSGSSCLSALVSYCITCSLCQSSFPQHWLLIPLVWFPLP